MKRFDIHSGNIHGGGRAKGERPEGLFLRRRAVLCSLLAALILSSGCSRTMNLEPPPPLTRRVAVLDFRVPADVAQTNFQIKGWWLGARSIFQNPQAGVMFADAFSRHLRRLEYVEQQSRRDVKYFMGTKRDLLMKSFPDLLDSDYTEMLAKVSPVDYGERLGVDQVLTGRIAEAYLSEHRTFFNWYSLVKVEVELWDVASGEVVWSGEFTAKKSFASQTEVMNALAPAVVAELDRDYYQLQDRPEDY